MLIKIDMREFERAMNRFGSESKKSAAVLLRQQAKLFVRDVVSITPPAHTTKASEIISGASALKVGKNKLVGDIMRIVQPMSQAQLDNTNDESYASFNHEGAGRIGEILHKRLRSIAEIEKWHQSRRNKRGVVPKINKRATTGLRKRDMRGLDVGYTTPGLLTAYVKAQVAKIGILASGWNAAANRLGLSLPAWITRHGSSRGDCEIITTSRSLKIIVTNAVRFVGDVKGVDRRVQWALNNRARQMDKQMDNFAIKKATRAAGFK